MQRCPECDEPIHPADINMKEGVALCPECGLLSQLSALTFRERSVDDILNRPPAGCDVTPVNSGVLISSSLRSMGGFLGIAGFSLFWNGIVSVFVLIALSGLYANLIGPLPDWFPAPGVKNGVPEMNDEPMDLGTTLFLCVFLTPFVAIGIGTAVTALIYLKGHVRVMIDENDSWVATGIGFVSWQRRFDPLQINHVRRGKTRWETNGERGETIELIGERTIALGSMLSAERREWLQIVLSQLLPASHNSRRHPTLPDLYWLSADYRH